MQRQMTKSTALFAATFLLLSSCKQRQADSSSSSNISSQNSKAASFTYCKVNSNEGSGPNFGSAPITLASDGSKSWVGKGISVVADGNVVDQITSMKSTPVLVKGGSNAGKRGHMYRSHLEDCKSDSSCSGSENSPSGNATITVCEVKPLLFESDSATITLEDGSTSQVGIGISVQADAKLAPANNLPSTLTVQVQGGTNINKIGQMKKEDLDNCRAVITAPAGWPFDN